jgi:membrane-associated phospholipid phosphatase
MIPPFLPSHPDAILNGRRSFPSGHSSLAFTGLTFLSIYLAACLCPSQATSTSSRLPNFLKSKALSVFITIAPLGVATWIAITRLEDYVCDGLILIELSHTRNMVSNRDTIKKT